MKRFGLLLLIAGCSLGPIIVVSGITVNTNIYPKPPIDVLDAGTDAGADGGANDQG